MSEEAARLRIIQITDVYTLKNFPHVKTLINDEAVKKFCLEIAENVIDRVSFTT